ncbi:hypothetical protein QUB10_19835 [Microcoleus sp. B5-D4]
MCASKENKGDRFWDMWMEKIDRPFGIRDEKGDRALTSPHKCRLA